MMVSAHENQNSKKRKVESGELQKKEARPSRIFSPFRVIGNVTNEVPFAVGSLGQTFYIVTSVGRSFQIYDVSTLHLLFVSQSQTASKISCLTAHFHYVYAGFDNKINIYRRGRIEHTLECDTTEVIKKILVFGDYLIGATSSQVFVFKKPTGTKLATEFYTSIQLSSLDGEIIGLIHSPTYLNKIVVATTKHILVINIRTGKIVFKSNEFMENISCLESTPALDIIAIGTSKGEVLLYNFKKGKLLRRIVTSESKVTSISFRTDGSHHLVAGSITGDLFFYDLERRSRIHILRNAHKESHGGISKCQFLNGQPIIVTSGGDNHLKEYVFDPTITTSNTSVVSPPRHLRSRGGHSAPPTAIQFSDDKSHYILSASRDRTFWQFSLRKDAQSQELSQRTPKSVNGKRVAGQVASLREKLPEIVCIAQQNVREGEWENVLTGHRDEHFARTWDSKNKILGRWTLATTDNSIIKSVAMSHCGNFGLVGSANGGIACYNLQSGILRKRYNLHKKAVTGIAVDGMNRKMVSVGLDGIVGFYDFTKSTYLGKLVLDAPITQMVYHKSSDLIALSLDDLSIVVIDVSTQRIIRVLYGHSNRITSLDISPNGRWIVSASLDATLRTWDLPTGGCIDGVRLPNVATSVKFSPKGDMLATTHVLGNGISLWTNRAQFKPISTRQVEEEEFSNILLPNAAGDGGSNMLDGAFDTEDPDLEFLETYKSLDQIDREMVTLSMAPRNKFNTLVHLDAIKQRNKPKEAPKKPENAPFFLSLSGDAVGDRAIVAEGASNLAETKSANGDDDVKLNAVKSNSNVSFESQFTKLLRECGKSSEFTDFISYLTDLSPAATDLEIRFLQTVGPLDELANFIRALTFGLNNNTNYDLLQAYMSMLLKNHGDIIQSQNDETVNEALEVWNLANNATKQKMDDLVKYCSGVINFLSTV